MFRFRDRKPRPSGRYQRFHLTKAGWIFILYSLGVGAGAINTGNNLLYIGFGLFLGVIMASGLLSDFALWRLAVTLHPPDFLVEGERHWLPITLRNNKKWLPSMAVWVELEGTLNGERVRFQCYAPLLLARTQTTSLVALRASARGLLILDRVTFRTFFPFGLLEKRWLGPSTGSFIKAALRRTWEIPVTPSPYILPPLIRQEGRSSQHKTAQKIDPGGASIVGVREFRPGDSYKRLHWKLIAKKNPWPSRNFMSLYTKEAEAETERGARWLWPREAQYKALGAIDQKLFVRFAGALLFNTGTLEKAGLVVAGADTLVPRLIMDSVALRFFLAFAYVSPELDQKAALLVQGRASPMDSGEPARPLLDLFLRYRDALA